jgi:dihydrofolate reductase/thymidylate synthase
MQIVVSFSYDNLGIGIDNKIPWNIPEDLKHFKDITTQDDSMVIMGRKTYESIPVRPLKNRFNIVITSSPIKYCNLNTENLLYTNLNELNNFIESYNDTNNKNIYIIGGENIYKKYLGIADKIHATIIYKKFETDRYFPYENFDKYEIETYSDLHYSETEKCNYRHVTYKLSQNMHNEYVYLNNMLNILSNGNSRNDRTGTGTISIFGNQLRFDISNSLPLITTKFVGYKSIIKELLFFINGKTDTKLLEKDGVNIWKGNTTREFLDSRGLNYQEGDIGPMYGFNWRYWNAEYKGCDQDYTGKGYDQLVNLIKSIKTDPYSRRHLLTTYNPETVESSVLCECHGIAIQFYVENSSLSCHMYQRSVDTFLGFPYNITSYSILTYIIAKLCNLVPKDLIISTGDTHIYNNHIDQVKLQLTRNPLPFPKLELNINPDTKLEDIKLEDFNVIGYLYHPSIKADMAV